MNFTPFDAGFTRASTHGPSFSRDELALANRNSGLLLETLSLDLTPTGAHYLLNHFDVPLLKAETHELVLDGAFGAPQTFNMDAIRQMPMISRPVTLECAGNGREGITPRNMSMPWMYEAVGTAEWSGTPLAPILEKAQPSERVRDFVFFGADEGFDQGHRHVYARSLTPQDIAELDVMLVWGMNGQPLLPQHGAPLRLIVPGWYGMASVKWLSRITASEHPFTGYQQSVGYHYRTHPDDAGQPIREILVKSLIRPPGLPDWTTRKRWMPPGRVTLRGRAWSGGGVPIEKVDVFLDGAWQAASLSTPVGKYAWTGWSIPWDATVGTHIFRCRATDARGHVQPLEAAYDMAGFGNNSVHRIEVHVREDQP